MRCGKEAMRSSMACNPDLELQTHHITFPHIMTLKDGPHGECETLQSKAMEANCVKNLSRLNHAGLTYT